MAATRSANPHDRSADRLDEGAPAPERRCESCGAPMLAVSTLQAIGRFPMQHIYKCAACRSAVAVTVTR